MPTIYEEGIPGQNSQSSSGPASASGLPGGGSGASGFPAEGRNANNMEQCLQMLGSYLERKKRYDNRGYRSAVRRQLKRLLQDNGIAFPDWLDDRTAPVMDWRDKAFKEIQSLKKTGKMTTGEGPGLRAPALVPPSSGGASGLPAEGTQMDAIQVAVNVQQQMANLQQQLGQALASLSTPPDTPRAMEAKGTPKAPSPPETSRAEEPSSPSSSELNVTDPREIRSEPPLSPRPMSMSGAKGLPEEGNAQNPSLQAAEAAASVVEAVAPSVESAAPSVEAAASYVDGGSPPTGTAAVEAAGQTAGPMETAAVPGQLDASGLPAEGSFILQDPMLQSVSSDASGPPQGWHMVQEPFQDISTIATQSVANMTDIAPR